MNTAGTGVQIDAARALLSAALLTLAVGCSSGAAESALPASPAPAVSSPSPSADPSPSPSQNAAPVATELEATVTMAGAAGATPDEKDLIATWRRAVVANQVALATSDPGYAPLLEVVAGSAEESVLRALTRNRDGNEYLLTEVTENVRSVEVLAKGGIGVLTVCETFASAVWRDLDTREVTRQGNTKPIPYRIGLSRAPGTAWVIAEISRSQKDTCP